MRISQLTEDQKGHLAYRLDHNTGCGLLTAVAIAKGTHGDLEIQEVFRVYGGCTPASAKILARKVQNFVTDAEAKKVADASKDLFEAIIDRAIKDDLSQAGIAKLYKTLSEILTTSIRSIKIMENINDQQNS